MLYEFPLPEIDYRSGDHEHGSVGMHLDIVDIFSGLGTCVAAGVALQTGQNKTVPSVGWSSQLLQQSNFGTPQVNLPAHNLSWFCSSLPW